MLFGGRLGTYKYLDMHMAIGSALSHVRQQAQAALRRRRGAGQRRSRRMSRPRPPRPSTTATPTVRRVLQRQILPDRPRHRRARRCTSTPSRPQLDADTRRDRRQPARPRTSTTPRSAVAPRPEPRPARRPDRAAHRYRVAGASGSPSAPTSTRFAGQLLAPLDRRHDVTLHVTRHRRAAPRVIVYRSMANGRSQRVDSATTDGAGRERLRASTCR